MASEFMKIVEKDSVIQISNEHNEKDSMNRTMPKTMKEGTVGFS